MDCAVCLGTFDVCDRLPLVLQCGHTYCSSCVSKLAMGGPIRCPLCSKIDSRAANELPRNYGLVDAAKLDISALLGNLAAREAGSSTNRDTCDDSTRQLLKLWLNESELRLSTNVLGSGATAQVVEGTYAGHPVAVKVIELSSAPQPVRQALIREATVVLKVSGECRHTCQYKGATMKGNKFCLVMKRYSKSLAHVLAEDGAPPDGLPLPRLLRYSAQTLGALHELHSMGVVMADLKPQNLLLDADLDEVVLTDFGISKILSNTVGSYTGTVMGQGTLYYMPPEQHVQDIDADGAPTVLTPAADMWSWACTVIQMAQGKPPFAGLNMAQIHNKVVVKTEAPAVPANLPVQMQELLSKCLVSDASARPTAMQALKVVNYPGLEGHATPSSPATTTPRWFLPAAIVTVAIWYCLRQLNDLLAALAQSWHVPLMGLAALGVGFICLSTSSSMTSDAKTGNASSVRAAGSSAKQPAKQSIARPNAQQQQQSSCQLQQSSSSAAATSDTRDFDVRTASIGELVARVSHSDRAIQAAAVAALLKESQADASGKTGAAIAAIPGCMQALIVSVRTLCSDNKVPDSPPAVVQLITSLPKGDEMIAVDKACCEAVVDLLCNGSAEAKHVALSLVACSARYMSDAILSTAWAPGSPGLQALVSMLGSSSERVQGATVYALCWMLDKVGASAVAGVMQVPGAVQALVSMLSSSFAVDQVFAASLLGHLAVEGKASVVADIVRKPNCVQALVGMLSSTVVVTLTADEAVPCSVDLNVQRAAVWTVDQLVSEASDDSLILMARVAGFLQAVAAMLNSKNDQLTAVRILRLLARVHNNKRTIVRLDGCLDSLVSLLHSPDKELYAPRAAALLGLLADSEETARFVGRTAGCWQRLNRLAEPGQPAGVREAATRALKCITRHGFHSTRASAAPGPRQAC